MHTIEFFIACFFGERWKHQFKCTTNCFDANHQQTVWMAKCGEWQQVFVVSCWFDFVRKAGEYYDCATKTFDAPLFVRRTHSEKAHEEACTHPILANNSKLSIAIDWRVKWATGEYKTRAECGSLEFIYNFLQKYIFSLLLNSDIKGSTYMVLNSAAI